jgi:hypothetical protein
MLIGTSLGKCLKSIMDKEVDEKDVVCIITATKSDTLETYLNVVKAYYAAGDFYPADYDTSAYQLEDVLRLAEVLYTTGKIHQPRNYSNSPFVHPKLRHQLWLDIVPTNQNSNPSVIEAYSKYKMLDALTK